MSTSSDKALKQKVRYCLKKQGEALVIRNVAEPISWAYVGASPLEWRAKQHAKLMACGDFAEALALLDDIQRELAVARTSGLVAISEASREAA